MAPSASTLHVAALHLSGLSQSEETLHEEWTGRSTGVVCSGYTLLAGYTSIFTVVGAGIGPGDRLMGFVYVELQPEHQPERYGAERKYRVEWDAE
jgi:hypothetical protein